MKGKINSMIYRILIIYKIYKAIARKSIRGISIKLLFPKKGLHKIIQVLKLMINQQISIKIFKNKDVQRKKLVLFYKVQMYKST